MIVKWNNFLFLRIIVVQVFSAGSCPPCPPAKPDGLPDGLDLAATANIPDEDLPSIGSPDGMFLFRQLHNLLSVSNTSVRLHICKLK